MYLRGPASKGRGRMWWRGRKGDGTEGRGSERKAVLPHLFYPTLMTDPNFHTTLDG